MKIVILDTADLVAEAAADLVESQVRRQPGCTLGLATGKTPIRLYDKLVQRHRDGRLSLAEVATFNLDEFVGLAADDDRSYARYMQRHFFAHVDLQPDNTHLPSCTNPRDHEAVCNAYEARIRECGGIDLQLLGIGTNGHIGFNEPSSSLGSRTRLKTLTPRTVRDNEAADLQLAVTMGIATIMDARHVLLLATGTAKAAAVAAAVEGPVSASCPASVLQFHRRATLLCDREAAANLAKREYYLAVQDIEARLQ